MTRMTTFVCPRCTFTTDQPSGSRVSHYCPANRGVETALTPTAATSTNSQPNPTRSNPTREEPNR